MGNTCEMAKRSCAFIVSTLPCLLSLSVPDCGQHRNPSKAFYQAFQSGSRLRDSKPHSDRYSTISVWARPACQSASICVQCSVAASLLRPRAWIEFGNKGWQQAKDWPTDVSTGPTVCNFLLNRASIATSQAVNDRKQISSLTQSSNPKY